jgi:hypothetical protein
MNIGPATGLEAAAAAISSLMEPESTDARRVSDGPADAAPTAEDLTLSPFAPAPAREAASARDVEHLNVKA